MTTTAEPSDRTAKLAEELFARRGPSHAMIIRRQFLGSAAVLLILLTGGCRNADSNTQYAPGLTEDAFGSVKVGDTPEQVIEAIGPALCIYHYLTAADTVEDRALIASLLQTYPPTDVEVVRTNQTGLFEFMYSGQINARRDYRYCSVRFCQGRVIDKTWHLVTE